eukprot:47140_1
MATEQNNNSYQLIDNKNKSAMNNETTELLTTKANKMSQQEIKEEEKQDTIDFNNKHNPELFHVKNQYFHENVKQRPSQPFNIGDLEKKKPFNIENEKETNELWFSKDTNTTRKLFTSINVSNLSNIDSDTETFRARFDINFTWIPKQKEYEILYRIFANAHLSGTSIPENIIIQPELHFPSSFEVHHIEWDVSENDLPYTITKSLQFGGPPKPNSNFRTKDTIFISSTARCDVTFIEEFELQQYPFDIQDLTLFICVKNKNFELLPQLKQRPFASIATECSEVGDYKITNGVIEFGEDCFTPSGTSTTKQRYNGLIIRLKAKRRWLPILLNTALIMFCLCVLSLTAFSIPTEEATDRMNFILTLILTAVASQLKSDVSSYLTLLDLYMFTSYIYLSLVMIQAAYSRYIDDELDKMFFYVHLCVLFGYHAIFAVYMFVTIKKENKKIVYGTDASRHFYKSRSSLSWFWQDLIFSGTNDRFLSIYNSQQTIDLEAILLDFLEGNIALHEVWSALDTTNDSVLKLEAINNLLFVGLQIFYGADNDNKPTKDELQESINVIRNELMDEMANAESSITYKEFKTFGDFLERKYAILVPTKLIDIFTRYATNWSGSLETASWSMDELILALKHFEMPVDTDKTIQKQVFEHFDLDEDGQIDYDEVISNMHAFVSGDDLETKSMMFKIFDADKDGALNLHEMA